jgi:ferredoxin-type protein NapH
MRYQRIRKPIVIIMAVVFHSVLIFHLLFSPVIIIMASNKGIINASFFSFILMFVLSLFFGRAYCAWLCPGCGVQEIIGFVVKKKAKYTKARYIKYAIFIIWIATIIMGYLVKGFTKVDLTYGMGNISLERKLILTLGAGIIIIPLAILFGKFASCKYICWQAPFMILGKKIRDSLKLPGLRIKTVSANCKKCNACTIKCPMDINVMEKVPSGEIIDDECILCGNCIDACKFKALSYRISILAKKL